MQKRVFIIHRWGGSPGGDWLPWLGDSLAAKNLQVIVPEMPDTNEPHIKLWVPYLSKLVGDLNEDTFFVGHSVGCQTILRYLSSINSNEKAGGAVFIAGWFHLIEGSIETEDDKKIEMEWTNNQIDFEAARKHLKISTACFSDNDPYVPLSDSKIFEERLGSKIIIHPKRGHFTSDDGVSELHVALNEILKMAR